MPGAKARIIAYFIYVRHKPALPDGTQDMS
jgi:hypothetical protein